MQRNAGGAVFEPAGPRQDKELTLGPGLLAALAGGLVALCAICFYAGYAAGRHASPTQTPAGMPAATAPSAAQLLSNPPKPAATQATAQPPADNPDSEAAQAGGEEAASSDGGVVPAALPAQGAAGDQGVHPALPQAAANGVWMVQIAAVSHPEDADVLVSALRKRGYNVSSRHDAVDNLIHVQVGPFSNHNDAVSMRQKLLNDGYNAIIQP